jgi:ubiquinone/menaquinone biosynthesis C-methylase UbiE
MQWRDREGAEPAAIMELVELNGKRVLDVGCGSGRYTAFAARHADHVYAFDPDAARVAQARAALSDEARARVRFAVHDLERLAPPRRRFDVALCGWSL